MATVYEAHDTRLDRTVALKVMHPSLAEDEEFVARFIREARSAARLSHPNVVAVYDQGADQGHVYLAMECVARQDAARPDPRPRPPVAAAGARGHGAGARGARRRARRRPRPPRRQARERAARPTTAGSRSPTSAWPARSPARPATPRRPACSSAPSPTSPPSRSTTARPTPLRRLRRRHPAVRDAHRQQALRRRDRDPGRLPARPRRRAAAVVGRPGAGGRARPPGGPGHQPRPRPAAGRRPGVPRRGGCRAPGDVRRRAGRPGSGAVGGPGPARPHAGRRPHPAPLRRHRAPRRHRPDGGTARHAARPPAQPRPDRPARSSWCWPWCSPARPGSSPTDR